MGAVSLKQTESLSVACPRFAFQDIEFGSAPLDRRAKTTGHGLNDKAANQNHIRDPRSKEETLNALTQTQKIRSHESVGRGEDPVRSYQRCRCRHISLPNPHLPQKRTVLTILETRSS